MTQVSYHAKLIGSNVQGVDIPRVGLGTWPLTGSECTRVVSQALEIGYRHIDTAENYANEDAVGHALRESGIARNEIFITTKFNKDSHGGPSTVREAAERALERLGLAYLDLFLIHWPNPSQNRYVQSCESLVELVDSGLIRSWGVSNFKPAHLHAVLEAGFIPPINQVQVDPEHSQQDIQEANSAANVLTAAYSPLNRGSSLLEHPQITVPAIRLERTPAQIVLRWHIQRGRIVIPRSANLGRQQQNLDLFNFELTAEEMNEIDALDTGEGARLDSDEFGH